MSCSTLVLLNNDIIVCLTCALALETVKGIVSSVTLLLELFKLFQHYAFL